jgi:hypothetical protein
MNSTPRDKMGSTIMNDHKPNMLTGLLYPYQALLPRGACQWPIGLAVFIGLQLRRRRDFQGHVPYLLAAVTGLNMVDRQSRILLDQGTPHKYISTSWTLVLCLGVWFQVVCIGWEGSFIEDTGTTKCTSGGHGGRTERLSVVCGKPGSDKTDPPETNRQWRSLM